MVVVVVMVSFPLGSLARVGIIACIPSTIAVFKLSTKYF